MRLSNLEEGSYNNTPEPKKMQVTVADKKANTEAWKRYQAGDSRYEFKNPTVENSLDNVSITTEKREFVNSEAEVTEAGGYYTQPVYDMIEQHGYEKVMHELLTSLDADVIQDFISRADLDEGKSPHKKGTAKYKKHMAAMHAESSTISTRQNFNTSDKGGIQKSNYTSHTRDFDSKKGLSTLTTAQQQDGSTSSRFVMPGGSGVATKNGVERNIQMKGPQSWAYDKPKLNASKEPKVREAGSPWTTTGKHPEKMTVDELWGEIAVFDHIQDRGERLTPKDMMRLDSLFSYMDTAEMNEAIHRKADSMMESAVWEAKKNK